MKMKAFFPAGVLAITVALGFAGCASPIQSNSLVVPPQSYGKQFSKTVAIQTAGGEDASNLGQLRVSNANLAAAIADSLRASKLFSAVVSVGESDYVLSATIISVDQPIFGGTFTVKTEVAWSLTPKGATKPIWEKSVHSSGTKSMDDAFVGATRLRMATEAATQENIRLAMNEIVTLNLP